MAKTVTEKPAKVTKSKKSQTASVAESSAKANAKPASAKAAAADKPASKAAGKRKLNDEAISPEPAKKLKKATVKSDETKPSEEIAPKDAKQKGKGKNKVVGTEDSTETKEPAVPKAKDGKSKKGASAKVKAKSPSPLTESDAEDKANPDAEEGGAADEEEEVQMFGFSTDDDDSSDDEMNDEPDALDVGKLPTIAKDDATVKRKLDLAKKKPTADRGVIYLGRIPHGFYEDQMKSYFTQFGEVTRLRLSRNKRTGKSKHYAFIEFDSSSVAQIVAETMDNYLLMGHILTCKVIPKDEVHSNLWVGANKKWRAVPRDRVARVQHNKSRTVDEQEKAEKRLLKRQAQKKRKLEQTGISYNFDAVAYKKKLRSADS